MASDLNLQVFPRYQQVRQYIESRIESGQYKPHEALPVERDLALQLGVGRVTVRKALKELEQRRIIHRIQGKGTFVIPKSERRRTSLVAVSFFDDATRSAIFSGACESLKEHHRFPIVVNYHLGDVQEEAQLIREVADQDVAGMLLTPNFTMDGPHRDNSELYRKIIAEDTPVVTMDRILPAHQVSAVVFDHVACERCMVEWLSIRGVNRVGYLGTRRGYIGQAKFDEMVRACRKWEMEFTPETDAILKRDKTSDFPRGFGQCAGADLLDRHRDLEALVCYSDELARGVLEAIRQQPARRGQLAYLMVGSSVGAAPFNRDELDGLTVMGAVNNPRQVGLKAAEMLMEQFAAGVPDEPVIRRIAPRLIDMTEPDISLF
jgi:DNA-binding LacI/PurR family transcriptional regulator